jgi:hypothetical protein
MISPSFLVWICFLSSMALAACVEQLTCVILAVALGCYTSIYERSTRRGAPLRRTGSDRSCNVFIKVPFAWREWIPLTETGATRNSSHEAT